MEAHSVWYDKIAKQINLHRETLDKKGAKKYKLDLLLRIAKRVDDFSYTCEECQAYKQEITRLIADLGNLIQLPSKEARRSYTKAINTIVKHLKKEHELVSEGHYLGIGMGFGTGIGAALGVALGNPGLGPALGVAIGLAIGSYLDKKAKKEGRVI